MIIPDTSPRDTMYFYFSQGCWFLSEFKNPTGIWTWLFDLSFQAALHCTISTSMIDAEKNFWYWILIPIWYPPEQFREIDDRLYWIISIDTNWYAWFPYFIELLNSNDYFVYFFPGIEFQQSTDCSRLVRILTKILTLCLALLLDNNYLESCLLF